MQRIHQRNENGFINYLELSRQTAFHEAGHAAAIHLENQRKNLPAIYFEIHACKAEYSTKPLFARIDGGRLINDLSLIGSVCREQNNDFPLSEGIQLAYEADIINLMVGPLAEAKYVSIRDQERFSLELLSPLALLNYGGRHDFDQVESYLECFIQSPQQRNVKLKQLFAEAFHFVQQPHHWKSITGLAHFLLHSTETVIGCEQASEVLDQQYSYANIDWL